MIATIILLFLLKMQIAIAQLPSMYQLSDEDKKDILDVHNFDRQLAANGGLDDIQPKGIIPDLKWDDSLAQFAYNYLQSNIKGDICKVKHNPHPCWKTSTGEEESVGENIVFNTWKDGVGGGIASWLNEYVEYTYAVFTKTPNFNATAHYTQLVWANTTQVGCAIANNCIDEYKGIQYEMVLLCNYAPVGNIIGHDPYTEKQPTPVSIPCQPENKILVTT